MTWTGSREFHKVLEFNLVQILSKFKYNQEFLEEIYNMFFDSGMTSIEVLEGMKILIEKKENW